MKLKHSFPLYQIVWSYFMPIRIEKCDTPYYLELVLSKNRLVLNSKNANQSNDSLQLAFHQCFHELNIYNRDWDRVLVLGFGLGSVASLLEEYGTINQMTAYENHPQVLAWLNTYYDTSSIHLRAESAENSVASGGLYDLILVDLFEDQRIPDFLLEKSFWIALKKSLGPEGLLIWNTLSDYPPSVSFLMEEVFEKKVDVLGMNSMWVCSMR